MKLSFVLLQSLALCCLLLIPTAPAGAACNKHTPCPVINFVPPAPTVTDTTAAGTVIANVMVTMNPSGIFSGSIGFASPYANDGGLFALSGSDLILAAPFPAGNSIQNATVSATQTVTVSKDLTVTVTAGGGRTAALPGHFGLGAKAGSVDLAWITASGAPWDYAYMYTGGEDNSYPPGTNQGISIYASDAFTTGVIPIFTYYENGGDLASLADSSYMNRYFSDWAQTITKAVNWANWSRASQGANGNLSISDDNTTLAYIGSTSGNQLAISGNQRPSGSGKYVFRFSIGAATTATHMQLGMASAGEAYGPAYLGDSTGTFGVGPGGLFINNSIVSSAPALTYATGDVVDIAVDFGAKLVWSRKNGGNWNNSSTANPSTGAGGASIATLTFPRLAPAASLWANGDQVIAQFSAPTNVSGFGAWNDPATLAKPMIIHSEPDMWGYMQQNYGTNPTSVPVAVASSGYPGLSDLPNNASGFAQALARLRDTYGPNVILAWHASDWGPNNGYNPTNANPPPGATAQVTGNAIGDFYNALQANFDLIFHDPTDADSAYQVLVRGKPSDTVWWTDAAFTNYLQYIGAVFSKTALKSMLWQVPSGNTLYRSLNNTAYHYQDNRPQYFLQAGNGYQNIVNLVGQGVIGLIFGFGGETTDYLDYANDGVTNPPPIIGNPFTATANNTMTATVSDDDGGFLRSAAGAYYSAGAIPLQ